MSRSRVAPVEPAHARRDVRRVVARARSPSASIRCREAPGQRADRVAEQDRVGLAVRCARRAARASGRARGAGRSRSSRSRSRRAARRARAPRGRAARASERASSRAPSWAASVATGLASGVHGPSTAWPSALSALAASSASGCEAESVGVVDHHPRAHGRRALVGARGAAVDAGHLRARQRGRDRHRDLRAAAGRRQRLGGVDHAAAAERHDPLARDRAEQLAGQLVDVARRRACARPPRPRRPPAPSPPRARWSAARSPRRRASRPRSAIVPRPKRIVRSPSRQVKPLRHGTLISRCSQAARNGSTIRTSPRSRATSSCRSSVSTARCTVDGPGRLWRLR